MPLKIGDRVHCQCRRWLSVKPFSEMSPCAVDGEIEGFDSRGHAIVRSLLGHASLPLRPWPETRLGVLSTGCVAARVEWLVPVLEDA